MDGRDGVAEGGLHLSAVFLGGLDGLLQIAHVVQRVEDADDVNAVFNALGAEGIHHVVGIVLVAQNVLAAEQHLQLGVLHMLADGAQALPRILVQEAHAGVEGGAAPAFHREVIDLVHLGQDRTHLVHGHAGSQQGLVRITQDHFGHFDRLFRHGCHLSLSSWKPERHRS